MKYLIYSLIAIFSVQMLACNAQQEKNQDSEETASSEATMELLSSDNFEKVLNENQEIQLVDVRTPGEYEQGHIPTAINIDVNGNNFETQVGQLNKDKPVMVYCAAGGRSANAAQRLNEMGFTHIIDLEGGIRNWKAADKEVANN